MIHLSGTAKRSFLFPSRIHESMEHYSKMEGLFKYLPHITLTQVYSPTQFRVLFSSTELSIYKIQLYCDLEVIINFSPTTNLKFKKDGVIECLDSEGNQVKKFVLDYKKDKYHPYFPKDFPILAS